MRDVILVKYGEVSLRGRNRYLHENMLADALSRRLKGLGSYWIRKEQGRLLIERDGGDTDFDAVWPRVKTVFGVVGFCPCVQTNDQSIENLKYVALAYVKRYYSGKPFTFKVETRRADKRYPLISREVSAALGGYIDDEMENASVNVHDPELVLRVELRTSAYIYGYVAPGLGGLPARSSGKGMLLLSGGIDSPVAGFLMAKRGVALSAAYFHAPPFVSERAAEKAYDLAARLAQYNDGIRLYKINFTPAQTYLHKHVPHEKLTIFLKRAMLRASDMLAEREGCLALITGDSVGQVASQTMHAIAATNPAASLPVLRPLAGMDKREIVELAKQIETYDISIRPYDDCCTLFVAKHPEVRPKASVIEQKERRLAELPALLAAAIDTAGVLEF